MLVLFAALPVPVPCVGLSLAISILFSRFVSSSSDHLVKLLMNVVYFGGIWVEDDDTIVYAQLSV